MPPAFPPLIGRDPKAEGFKFASDFKLVHTIGNYWPHATTVFDYVRRAMPLLQPGSPSFLSQPIERVSAQAPSRATRILVFIFTPQVVRRRTPELLEHAAQAAPRVSGAHNGIA